MTLVNALGSIVRMSADVFETSDAAARLSISRAHASTLMARLASAGHVIRLRRGLWALPDRVGRLALPGHLTAPLPSYVSLQSALYIHGMISQVPAITYAVSLARARQYTTPLGVVSIHHVAPGFFFGFAHRDSTGECIATPEKALVDFLYLAPARTGLFRALPELELPRSFSARRAHGMLDRIESPSRREMVARALTRLIPSL